MNVKVGDKYILTHGFFSGNERVGQEIEIVKLLDEKGGSYLAMLDKLGVSIPYKPYYIL